MNNIKKEPLDRTNVVLAGIVLIISLVVYALTVQRSLSFWDCGEFIACAYIVGIPHPPGFPLYILIGRIFSVIPFVEDIAYRINYISVISSAFTAMFSYLLVVRLVGYLFKEDKDSPLNRYIAYIGGIAGGLFVAFSQTNWANAVEAEVYGLALALSVMIVWLTMKYYENRGTITGTKIMLLAFYLALLGVGIHMTVFMVVPTCAIFFILKKDAVARDWLILCGFVIVELLLVILLADGRGGPFMFYLFTALLGLALLIVLYKKINWAILIAIGSASSIMLAFSKYMIMTPMALAALVILGIMSKKYNWNLQWKPGLALVVIAFLGTSIHLMIPIRSAHNPRIDENNPSRDWRTFVYFLDRKQYGEVSMFERMFQRRGLWSNQFGRHPHMGFWSYFEEQYSTGGWGFVPFLALGLIGMVVAIKKRLEIGLPFFTLFLICSVGLVLYMNFADGTQYSFMTGDAYLEVRNRDYFFTPTFVFFAIAMGIGVSAVMQYLRDRVRKDDISRRRMTVIASSVLVLLPAVSLAHSYHTNDRSENFIPYNYATNMLDTCEENAILFTGGDNDTFPLWCLQEVYDYRKDITIVNLSLLNTDWYVEQMKNRYGVPISLEDDQILWYPFEAREGLWGNRPLKPFVDRPRGRKTYLSPSSYEGQRIRVQDMMVDEIVLENKWQRPIYFSSAPYAESPLRLRAHATGVGMLFRLDREPDSIGVDVEKSWRFYVDDYRWGGLKNSDVYRDENATGVFIGMGVGAVRLFNGLLAHQDEPRAMELGHKVISEYPEYWQLYTLMVDRLEKAGDSAGAMGLMTTLHDTLSAFYASNEENIFYIQDLGLIKEEMGRRQRDPAMIEQGIRLLRKAFELFPNSPYGYRKLVTVLIRNGRTAEARQVTQEFARYRRNLDDPYVQSILGISSPTGRR